MVENLTENQRNSEMLLEFDFTKNVKIKQKTEKNEFRKEFEDWKTKNGIQLEKKVFICTSIYPDIKKALVSRGWVENQDQSSRFFDLKWVLRPKDIDHEGIDNSQLANHFDKSSNITRKSELCKNLRNITYFRNVNMNSFFPRCYYLGDINDFNDFIEDFKTCKAENILKDFLLTQNNGDIKTDSLSVAYRILEKKLVDINDIIDLENSYYFNPISEKQWELISQEKKLYDLETVKRNLHMIKTIQEKKQNSEPENENITDFFYGKSFEEIKSIIQILIEKLKSQDKQFSFNRGKNIWILKPSGLSRGRGIGIISTMNQFTRFLKSNGGQYVIQKYMENQLIVKNRKFDIRQWVVVTSWNPLTIWIYEKPYIRFSAEDYNPDDLSNKFIHLTNNCVAKNSSKFGTEPVIEGNMWEIEQFQSYLKETYGFDVWNDKLKEKIKDVIVYSLEPAQDLVEERVGTHELYGFDLMIDDDLNVWLIEINCSPCLDYSTKITEKLVKSCLEDLIKIVVDNRNNQFENYNKEEIHIGDFRLGHKGEYVERSKSLGLNLLLTGEKITNYEGL